MTLPNKYLTRPEGAIGSYNWTDIASGLGYVTFYLASSVNGVTTSRHLSNIPFYGEPNSKALTASSGSPANNIDYDTTPFNLPAVIGGVVVFDMSGYATSGGVSNWYCDAYLYHIKKDGTSTQLAFFDTEESSSGNQYFTKSSQATIATTKLKRGDYLRLRISLSFDSTAGYLYTDPTLEITTALGTSMLHIPFRIDI